MFTIFKTFSKIKTTKLKQIATCVRWSDCV